MKQVKFCLPKGTMYVCDETEQPTYRDYYTVVKIRDTDTVGDLYRKASNNLCKQLYKDTGVWWQYIHFSINDLTFDVMDNDNDKKLVNDNHKENIEKDLLDKTEK